MIKGVVKQCYTCSPKKCASFKQSFCWINHEILTVTP